MGLNQIITEAVANTVQRIDLLEKSINKRINAAVKIKFMLKSENVITKSEMFFDKSHKVQIEKFGWIRYFKMAQGLHVGQAPQLTDVGRNNQIWDLSQMIVCIWTFMLLDTVSKRIFVVYKLQKYIS